MSVSRELEFVERRPGVWFYVLEDAGAPRDSWDWHEHATAYGPFNSLADAEHHQYGISRVSTPGATITEHTYFHETPALADALNTAALDRAL